MTIVLGIEATAHTFGIAIIDDKRVLANERSAYTTDTGGMIPVKVAQHHEEAYLPTLYRALEKANITLSDVQLIAFSDSPGLGHSLRIGAAAAKSLAMQLRVPLVGVNHCIAHLEVASLVTAAKDPVLLYCSGANTQVIAYDAGKYRIFGETLDTGIGNFLDTLARNMNLGFPGGPKIEKLALSAIEKYRDQHMKNNTAKANENRAATTMQSAMLRLRASDDDENSTTVAGGRPLRGRRSIAGEQSIASCAASREDNELSEEFSVTTDISTRKDDKKINDESHVVDCCKATEDDDKKINDETLSERELHEEISSGETLKGIESDEMSLHRKLSAMNANEPDLRDYPPIIALPYTIKGMDVSFAGLETNLMLKIKSGQYTPEELAYSAQEHVFAMLVETAERALAHVGKTELVLGGGVACNKRLQEMCRIMCLERGATCFIPANEFLVDNAAMIAWTGLLMHEHGGISIAPELAAIKPYERTDDVDVTWR